MCGEIVVLLMCVVVPIKIIIVINILFNKIVKYNYYWLIHFSNCLLYYIKKMWVI